MDELTMELLMEEMEYEAREDERTCGHMDEYEIMDREDEWNRTWGRLYG